MDFWVSGELGGGRLHTPTHEATSTVKINDGKYIHQMDFGLVGSYGEGDYILLLMKLHQQSTKHSMQYSVCATLAYTLCKLEYILDVNFVYG